MTQPVSNCYAMLLHILGVGPLILSYVLPHTIHDLKADEWVKRGP